MRFAGSERARTKEDRAELVEFADELQKRNLVYRWAEGEVKSKLG